MSLAALLAAIAISQNPAASATELDYRETLAMLGIQNLRPGADGFNPNAPNAQNTDESKAELYGNYPDLLRFDNGAAVDSPAKWQRKRKELLEHFDREIYGRTPPNLPRVSWKIESTEWATEGEIAVTRTIATGTVDNRRHPEIEVTMPVVLTVPKNAKGRVPVVMMFSFGRPGAAPRLPGNAPTGPSPMQQILAKGWGVAQIYPNETQADHGGGLRRGIIGLANGGRLRKPDEWGALKAWGWGASRALDFLATQKSVDARKVAIEGMSRYGKAALVTMVYDPRFAAAFVGSSGAGGAKLWRRDFGEREGNVASSGEYHWMAPNFIRYAGPKNPGDMPVDSHQLIALCATRTVFVGVGSPRVEGTWVDATGMFKATAMASPAWELLGKRGLRTAAMPPEDRGLLEGELAWRQHSGGHTNGPNWPSFLEWIGRYWAPSR